MRVGATGFLVKDLPGEELVRAIRQAARGADSLLAPSVTRRLIERFVQAPPQRALKPPALLPSNVFGTTTPMFDGRVTLRLEHAIAQGLGFACSLLCLGTFAASCV